MAPGKGGGNNKKATQAPAKKKAKESFPGLKVPTGPVSTTTKTPYQELQEDEVTALQAIYADDFIQHAAAHSAWKVCWFISSIFNSMTNPISSIIEEVRT